MDRSASWVTRAVLLGAVLGITCGSRIPKDPRVEFVPHDTEPRCDVAPNSPPDALRERDELFADWREMRARLAAWQARIATFADELGVHGADESLVMETVTGELDQLAKAGCSLQCEDHEAECTDVSMRCPAGADTQQRADAFAEILDHNLPKLHELRAAEDKRLRNPVSRDDHALIVASPSRGCDYNLPNVHPARDFDLGRALFLRAARAPRTAAVRAPVAESCPGSMLMCRTQCEHGDMDACSLAMFDPSLSAADKVAFRIKACDLAPSGPIVRDKDPKTACLLAVMPDALGADPTLRARAEAFVERLCTGAVPSEKCSYAAAGVASQPWFRARPLYKRLAAALPVQCAAMGASSCAMMIGGFYENERPQLSTPALSKIAVVLRKACDAGEVNNCVSLSELGDAVSGRERGRVLVRACDLDVSGCYRTAWCTSSHHAGKCGDLGMTAAQGVQAHVAACDKIRPVVSTFEACEP